ncbi:MAG: peptidoglycan DD-metalloendopeptidase family protein [Calothrix sp. FI2-JRJ7]|nr:peptidoglycan DD-metalloendopeptidase family protein [Calothrix sp. FI2-JRJ7]
MKRVLKSKVKANLENNSSEDATVDSLNLPSQKVNRRKRTSAAMIGLAISMGAGSLFVTRQSDQALAAEPVGNQNTASAIPAAGDTGVKLATTNQMGSTSAVSNVSAPENPVPVVEPTAISQVPGLGAKLQIAASSEQFAPNASSFTKATTEQNSVSDVQTANKGQRIGNAIARVQAKNLAQAPVPTSYGITNGTVAQSLTANTQTLSSFTNSNNNGDVDAQLKAQQEFAINKLQEKSDRLRNSLNKLRLSDEKLSQQQNQTVRESQHSQYTATNSSELSATPNNANVAEMPNSVVGAVVPSASKVYEVKSGDTLAVIASSNGTSVNEIIKANGIQNPNELKINQKLNIPVANVPTTSATPSVTVLNQKAPVASNVAIPTPARLGTVASNDTVAPVVVPTPVATTGASIVQEDSTPIDPQANGVGGETAPKVFAEMQQRNATSKQAKQDRGLRSLQAEIERLREKYRAQQSGSQVPTQANLNNVSVPVPTYTPNAVTVPSIPAATRRNNIAIPVPTVRPNTVAIPIPVPTPMAPNFSAEPVKSEWSARTRNNNRLSVPPVPTTVNASESLGKMRGVTVSPQLPPLAAVDRYLPRAIDENTPPIAPVAPGVGNTAFIWPAKGVLTSGYGWRWGRMHRGIDVANSVGTPVYAAASGVIEKSGWNNGGYGNLVEVRHADGTMTRYGHNSKLMVQVGQQVNQGDIIALMGSTGFSTGPHTHFEIHKAGKGAVNPIAMLPPRV